MIINKNTLITSSQNINTEQCLLHIARNNNHNPSDFKPFFIENKHIGYIEKEFLPILTSYSNDFKESQHGIILSESLNNFDKRSHFFDTLLHDLLEKKMIEPFRDEFYAVAQHIDQDPFLRIRRGAASYFGFRNYGVHLNGYVIKNNQMFMWIGVRSSSKQIAPGKLDHIVGGGLPMGLSVFENLVKEAQEEANIPLELLQNAQRIDPIHYCRQTGPKLRRDTIFVYDLELPESFIPRNADGEVESFTLMPIDDVIAALHEPDAFKFNCNLVLIDFLIRHQFISKNDVNYTKIKDDLYKINFDHHQT
jgi:8-oxo-dGTP pyrophosphatase MutT (NUDIX family)